MSNDNVVMMLRKSRIVGRVRIGQPVDDYTRVDFRNRPNWRDHPSRNSNALRARAARPC